MNTENLKTIGYSFPTKQITQMSKDFKAAGYEVNLDKQAGTMVVKLDGRVMARALQIRTVWCLRAVDGLLTPVEA